MAHVKIEQNVMKLLSMIDFNNADVVYQEGLRLLKNTPVSVVDLSELKYANTLILAVILQWFKAVGRVGELKLIHVPDKMTRILQASHLEFLAT